MRDTTPRTLTRRKVLAGMTLAAAGYAGKGLLGSAQPARAAGEMVFPGADWATATPESQGVDSALLQVAMNFLASKVGADGLNEAMVVRNGYVIWQGPNIHNTHNIWSATKVFTTSVLASLIADGQISLSSLAVNYVPQLADLYPAATIRHFVNMTSGYNPEGGNHTLTWLTPSTPLFPVGTKFGYSDAGMNVIGYILTQVAQETLMSFFARRVAAPIGMISSELRWRDWGVIDGYLMNGGSGNKGRGVWVSASNFARLAHLYLNRGNWNGTQVLSADWVDQATSVQVPANFRQTEPGGGPGVFGYSWWVNGVRKTGDRFWREAPPGTFGTIGHYDNRVWVIPEWNMVIVRMGTADDLIAISQESNFLMRVGRSIIA